VLWLMRRSWPRGVEREPVPREAAAAGHALTALLATSAGAALAAVGAVGTAHAQPPPEPCHSRLIVQLSPEVPDQRDPGFLSSLEGTPGFRLVWKGHSNTDMTTTLELIGPGPAYRCMQEVDRMRNDARVIDLRVAGQ